MRTIPFDGANKNFEATRPGELDMPAYTDGMSHVTCWQLTPEELKEVMESKKIYLVVVSGINHPGVAMSTKNPTPRIAANPLSTHLSNIFKNEKSKA